MDSEMLNYNMNNAMETQSVAFSDSTTDTMELLQKKEKYFQWFVKHFGMPKMSWPNAVGDVPDRASCIVRYGTPFYTITAPYKTKEVFGYDPLRVILFLDPDGFVAVRPKVG